MIIILNVKRLGLISLLSFFIIAKPRPISAQSNFLKTYNFIGYQGVNSIIQTSNNDFLLVGSSQGDRNSVRFC